MLVETTSCKSNICCVYFIQLKLKKKKWYAIVHASYFGQKEDIVWSDNYIHVIVTRGGHRFG